MDEKQKGVAENIASDTDCHPVLSAQIDNNYGTDNIRSETCHLLPRMRYNWNISDIRLGKTCL